MTGAVMLLAAAAVGGPQDKEGRIINPGDVPVLRGRLQRPPRPPLNGPQQFWLRLELDDSAAIVHLNGMRMKSTGMVRDYVTEEFEGGEHPYHLRVEWPGGPMTYRRLTVWSGCTLRLKLSKADVAQ